MTETTKVGFIGLGNIGTPIARHLLGKNFKLHIHDLVPAAMTELEALGALAMTSVAQLAAECRYIGVCVRDDNDVESWLFGADGQQEQVAPHSVISNHINVTHQGLL
jgi:3-hydroxyisobutyrate dehydrogenase